MKHSTPLMSRRMLGVAAACVLAFGSSLTPALAATPKDTLVVAFAFDDIITMDPGEAFEISAGEIMGNAYDRDLRAQARVAADATGHGAALHEGVYAWFMGPQFETPAEIRMLRTLGGHAVGMSTVPETILARHAGLRVLALSLFTNMAAGMQAEALSHAHTLATANAASERAVAVLAAVVQALEV